MAFLAGGGRMSCRLCLGGSAGFEHVPREFVPRQGRYELTTYVPCRSCFFRTRRGPRLAINSTPYLYMYVPRARSRLLISSTNDVVAGVSSAGRGRGLFLRPWRAALPVSSLTLPNAPSPRYCFPYGCPPGAKRKVWHATREAWLQPAYLPPTGNHSALCGSCIVYGAVGQEAHTAGLILAPLSLCGYATRPANGDRQKLDSSARHATEDGASPLDPRLLCCRAPFPFGSVAPGTGHNGQAQLFSCHAERGCGRAGRGPCASLRAKAVH